MAHERVFRIDIIIPIWNQPALTERCLNSLATATQIPYRLLLVDNGSQTPTRELLDRAAAQAPDRIRVVRNPQNLGFVKAVNQGIRASDAPYICLLNNDTVVAPGWLEEMIRVAEQDPSIGLVNPSSNTLGFHPPDATLPSIARYAAGLATHRGQTREMAWGVGFCLLIKRTVLETIGLFDEQFGLGNFEDTDFSMRAVEAGYRCVQAVGAYVYHEEKASFKQHRGWEKAFAANQRLFHERWGRSLRIVWEDHRRECGMRLPAGQAGDAECGMEASTWTIALLQLLRKGHWIRYSVANGVLVPEVRQFVTAEPLAQGSGWRWAVLWHVLKRRRKPVDLVVTHDLTLHRWLTWLRSCHRARLLWRPTPADVEELCKRLSRFP